MPRSELFIELDDPKSYFEILEGERFKDSKVEIKAQGSRLVVKVEAQSPKALITSIASLIKQVRIIEQTTESLRGL